MKRGLAIAAGFVAVTAASPARADYLEVRRPALLKRSAERESATVQPLKDGDLVDLIGTEQRSGYYQVKTQDGTQGFVYRTLVRRHRGPLPSAAPAESEVDDPEEPGPAKGNEDVERGLTDEERHEGEHRAEGELETLSDSGVPTMRAHLINVGQGAATLFEFSCGAVLVDTGGESNGQFDSDRALEAQLEDFFDRRPELDRTIDLLAITHAHRDHAHGAELVTTEFKVENVVTNGFLKNLKGNYHSSGRQQEGLEDWARTNAELEIIQTTGIPKGGKTSGVIDPVQCADEDPRIRLRRGLVPGHRRSRGRRGPRGGQQARRFGSPGRRRLAGEPPRVRERDGQGHPGCRDPGDRPPRYRRSRR